MDQKNPDCYVLDLGCSLGLFSVISLFASEKAKVIAFDSDISSLKATLKMCQYATSGRINVVFGLISNESTIKKSLSEAIAATAETLAQSDATGDPGTTHYINLDRATKDIPFYYLDDLFDGDNIVSPVLLKCDIEGAELLALTGAKKFINKYKPDILLSVHPDILPVFNGSVTQVRDFLNLINYSVEVIAIDHEEHWWCRAK